MLPPGAMEQTQKGSTGFWRNLMKTHSPPHTSHHSSLSTGTLMNSFTENSAGRQSLTEELWVAT